MAIVDTLLTAEEFRLMPDNGEPAELVRGRIVPMNMPAPKHGYCCNKIGRIVGNFTEDHDLGRVMSNDSGVVTERGPDTVRGADVCYYSYQRLPRGPIPEGYLAVVPEVIFEVRSPGDRSSEIHAKVSEYLDAGVIAVCVLCPQSETLTIFTADKPPQVLTVDAEFSLPDLFPGLRVVVRNFLE